MKIYLWFVLSIAAMTLLVALTGCTLTIEPDGSKSATLDAPSAIRVLEIIATK